MSAYRKEAEMTTTTPQAPLPSAGLGPSASPGSSNGLGGSADGGRRRGQRRWSWAVVGLLAVAGSILAFVAWTALANERSPVLVAGRAIEAGQIITQEDVRVVQLTVDPGINLLGRDQQDLIVGQQARTAIRPGTPFTEELTVVGESLPDGAAVVGAVLDAGEYPATAIGLGDGVLLMEIGLVGGGEQSESREIGTAEVWAIERLENQSEPRYFVSFIVPAELQLEVATASGQDRLRVSLVREGS